MAFTIVSHGSGAPSIISINTLTANLIILTCSGSGSNNPPTDTQSNTWTPLTAQAGGFGSQLQFWYCINPSTSAGHGFTDNDTTPAISAIAINNPNPISFDQESGSFQDPNAQPGAITPSQIDEILIASGGTCWFGGVPGIDSGFTVLESEDLHGGVNFSVATAVIIETSIVTKNPIWTPGASAAGASSIMAAFKASGAAPANPSRLSLLGVG